MSLLLRTLKIVGGVAAVAALSLIVANYIIESDVLEAIDDEDGCAHCETRPSGVGDAFHDQLLHPRKQ